MRISPRIVILAILLWLAAMLLYALQKQAHSPSNDSSRIMGIFAGLMLVGTAIAVIVALTVVPTLGEWVGAYFFAPKEEIKSEPHSAAISRLAQGDPDGALAEYRRVLANDPEDTLAYSEMARICCRDLGDPARAAALLHDALQQDWPPEQAALLANRLTDVYVEQGDMARAQTILEQVIETLPETKFAASAHHRLGQLAQQAHAHDQEQAALTDEES